MRGARAPTVAGLLDAHVSQDWVQGGLCQESHWRCSWSPIPWKVLGLLPPPTVQSPHAHAGVGWSPSGSRQPGPAPVEPPPHVAAVERVRGQGVGEV